MGVASKGSVSSKNCSLVDSAQVRTETPKPCSTLGNGGEMRQDLIVESFSASSEGFDEIVKSVTDQRRKKL